MHGASSDRTVEAILWGGASGRSAEAVRMALERIDWPRDDPRWFWMLWRPLPGHRDLNEAEQADSRATFRLILERCDPNLQARESGQTLSQTRQEYHRVPRGSLGAGRGYALRSSAA